MDVWSVLVRLFLLVHVVTLTSQPTRRAIGVNVRPWSVLFRVQGLGLKVVKIMPRACSLPVENVQEAINAAVMREPRSGPIQ